MIKYICEFCGKEHISYVDSKWEFKTNKSKSNWIESNNYGWSKR